MSDVAFAYITLALNAHGFVLGLNLPAPTLPTGRESSAFQSAARFHAHLWRTISGGCNSQRHGVSDLSLTPVRWWKCHSGPLPDLQHMPCEEARISPCHMSHSRTKANRSLTLCSQGLSEPPVLLALVVRYACRAQMRGQMPVIRL